MGGKVTIFPPDMEEDQAFLCITVPIVRTMYGILCFILGSSYLGDPIVRTMYGILGFILGSSYVGDC